MDIESLVGAPVQQPRQKQCGGARVKAANLLPQHFALWSRNETTISIRGWFRLDRVCPYDRDKHSDLDDDIGVYKCAKDSTVVWHISESKCFDRPLVVPTTVFKSLNNVVMKCVLSIDPQKL